LIISFCSEVIKFGVRVNVEVEVGRRVGEFVMEGVKVGVMVGVLLGWGVFVDGTGLGEIVEVGVAEIPFMLIEQLDNNMEIAENKIINFFFVSM